MLTNINTDFSHLNHNTHSHFVSIFQKEKMLINEHDFEKYLTINKGLSKRSIRTYLIRFRVIRRWLKENNSSLSRATVGNFLFQKKEKECLSNSTVNTYSQVLKQIANCYKYHDLEGNFMEGINSLPKKKPYIIPLSKDEVSSLLEANVTYANRNGVNCSNLDDKYLTLTEFLIFTGCRYDEAASITVGQLDVDNGRAFLTETKNKENRFIFFNGPIKEHLRKLIKDKNPENLVFTNSKEGKIHPGDFGNNLKKRAKLAGITKHIHPHLLRHTYATQFYNYTHDIAMVATILGHKDIQTTYDTYVHLDTEGIQQATNRHPLLSPYIPIKDVLLNIKSLVDRFKLGDDKRLQYDAVIENNELKISIKEASIL